MTKKKSNITAGKKHGILDAKYDSAVTDATDDGSGVVDSGNDDSVNDDDVDRTDDADDNESSGENVIDDEGDEANDLMDDELEADEDSNVKSSNDRKTRLSPSGEEMGEPAAKKSKLTNKELYKPPTNDELNQLKETENLFHSTLFRMQITELLSEVKLKAGRRKQMEKAVGTLKTLLMGLPQGSRHEISDEDWLKKTNCKIPLYTPQSVKGSFQFLPPTQVKVTGSFLHETCVKPNIHIDLMVEMPQECLGHKDSKNHCYLRKRALYLTYIATQLQKSSEIDDLQFLYHHGNYLKPILMASVKVEGHRSVKVNLLVVPAEGFFKLNRFDPSKNNVRSKWFHGKKGETSDSEDLASTPMYNSSLIEDLTVTSNRECLQRLHEDNSGLKEGIMLLKIWLRQRELDRGYGSFSAFIMSMYVIYLLSQRKLNIHMSSYQVMRNTLLRLAESDWSAQGISMCHNSSDPNQPDIGTFHTHYEIVFVDSTGYHNLCSHMLESTYNRVKHEAEIAIRMMEEKSFDSFDVLFMKKMPFTHTFDHIIHLTSTGDIELSVEKLNKQNSLVDYGGHYTYCCLPIFIEKLKKGLGKRIHQIQLRHDPPQTWSVNESAPGLNRPDKLTLGLLVDGEFSCSVLDKGPSADSQEAEEFRRFWGEKSELRRFQDGGICEAVLWMDKTTVDKKRTICHQIVQYILERHAGISPSSVHYVAGQIDTLLHLPIELKSQTNEPIPYGTGEEQNVSVMHAYDDLCKMIRKLSDLPLTITSTQGTSPCFRYSEVFTPVPASFRYHGPQVEKEDFKMFIPTPDIACQPYTPTLKVICTLEASGKWPDNVEAIRRLKAAFHIKLSEALKSQFKLPVRAGTTFVDVLKNHYVFRLILAYSKESLIMKTIRTPEGMIKMRDTDESLHLERETVALPRLTSTLHGLQQQYSSFSTSVRLAKRWICAQMLGDYIHEVAVELVVASFYLSPYPYTQPRSGQAGFQRFLSLLATHDWKTKPLLVNLNDEFTVEDLTEIPNQFTQERATLPLMFLSTPLDKYSSHWTRDSPTAPILQRLVLLAQKSLQVIEGLITMGTIPDFKPVFRPPTEMYDVLIHLNLNQLPRQHEAVDITKETTIPRYKPSPDSYRLPITDFDPVKMYLNELRESFDELALFFYDQHGGRMIGVLWRPSALTPKDFKIDFGLANSGVPDEMLYFIWVFTVRQSTHLGISGTQMVKHIKVSQINYSKPQADSEERRGVQLVPDIKVVLEDFKILGEGLVDRIETRIIKDKS